MSLGGILSDSAIRKAVERGAIIIDPFDPSRLNPCSYDLTLGDEVAVYHHGMLQPHVFRALVEAIQGVGEDR